MGIWAPLEVRRDGDRHLWLSSGWGTLKLGLGILAFGLTLGIMRYATLPLTNPRTIQDPLLNYGLPLLFLTLIPILMTAGILILGYRKNLIFSFEEKILRFSKSVWGIPLLNKAIPFGEISQWKVENRLPKRYKPEVLPAAKAVGYWRISLLQANGKTWILDEAPQEEEVRTLKEILERSLQPKS